MEWTSWRWILVKDPLQVCDSVINLTKLKRGEPKQQNHRLLTEGARGKKRHGDVNADEWTQQKRTSVLKRGEVE